MNLGLRIAGPDQKPEPIIKVFKLDDYEWWAGESLEAVLKEARSQCGEDCYSDPDDHQELSNEEMEQTLFRDEDGKPLYSFKERLKQMIARGETFPQLFAAVDS